MICPNNQYKSIKIKNNADVYNLISKSILSRATLYSEQIDILKGIQVDEKIKFVFKKQIKSQDGSLTYQYQYQTAILPLGDQKSIK